jgi:hypothetical protein
MALLLLPQCGDLGERDARIGLRSGGQGVFKRPASPRPTAGHGKASGRPSDFRSSIIIGIPTSAFFDHTV